MSRLTGRGLPGRTIAVLLGTALVGFGLPVPVSAVPATGGTDSPEAVNWLRRAAVAPQKVSFRATQLITSWGPQSASSAMLEIVHSANQGSQVSVLGAGPTHSVKAFVQRSASTAARPTVDGGPLSLLTETYDVTLAGPSRVIGRPAMLVEAFRPDRTLAARFWIDTATGLLLQRHLFTVDGRSLVRATVYTDLTVLRPDFLGHLPPTMRNDDSEALPTSALPDLRAQGWNCADVLSDSLRLYEVHRDPDGHSLQFSYSDGLFGLSVFEQRGTLDPAAMTGYTAISAGDGSPVYVRYGMPSYAVWSAHGIVYTLVGDIPYDVMERVVAAFPHERPDEPGVVDRVSNGLARMTMWLTPMGAIAPDLG
jgi:negative regulator of sigma E activity